MLLRRRLATSGALLLVVVLTSCGGGGSGPSSAPIPPSGPTPCPSGYQGSAPNCSAYTTASISGSVVDYKTGVALAGIRVALAPWAATNPWTPPSPVPVATTDPSGAFTATASPGPYLLVIGSDSASDTRATVHQYVSLNLGPNPLKAPGPTYVTDWTVPASEQTGQFRLMTLDQTVQGSCLSAINTRRASLGLKALIPDEWLEETSYDVGEAFINNGGGQLVLNQNSYVIGPTTNCDSLLVSYDFASTSPSYNLVTGPYLLWYGGAYFPDPVATRASFALEQLAYDPRIAIPCSGASGAFTPGPGNCQPAYTPWPGQQGGYPTPSPTATPPVYGPVFTASKPQPEPPGSKLVYNANDELSGTVGFDRNGNLVVYTYWNSLMFESLSATGSDSTAPVPSSITPFGCAYDTSQQTWCESAVNDVLQPSITEVDTATGTTGASIALSPDHGQPSIGFSGLLFDGSGGGFWAAQWSGDVTHFTASGSIISSTTVGGSGALGSAFDSSGNIWLTIPKANSGGLADVSSAGMLLGQYLPTYFANEAFKVVTVAPAFDQQGNMWLVGDQRFDKVSPSGQILATVGVLNNVYVALQALVDAKGNAWLLSDYVGSPYVLTTAVLTEVDPSGKVVANYFLGSNLQNGLTYGSMALDSNSRLWILLDRSNPDTYPGLSATIFSGLAEGPQFSTTETSPQLSRSESLTRASQSKAVSRCSNASLIVSWHDTTLNGISCRRRF